VEVVSAYLNLGRRVAEVRRALTNTPTLRAAADVRGLNPEP
jgi:hypothetical protein